MPRLGSRVRVPSIALEALEKSRAFMLQFFNRNDIIMMSKRKDNLFEYMAVPPNFPMNDIVK